jgi:sugar phosphate isomerase/epimerase
VKDQRGRVPDFEFLIPGEGPFDFVEYLEEMHKAGYEGYITAEVSMAVQRRPDYDPLAAAELCYRTLDRAFQEAGIER